MKTSTKKHTHTHKAAAQDPHGMDKANGKANFVQHTELNNERQHTGANSSSCHDNTSNTPTRLPLIRKNTHRSNYDNLSPANRKSRCHIRNKHSTKRNGHQSCLHIASFFTNSQGILLGQHLTSSSNNAWTKTKLPLDTQRSYNLLQKFRVRVPP